MGTRSAMHYDAMDRLVLILDRADEDATMYVYRQDAKGKIIHPFLLKCVPWPDLMTTLRDEHGGGCFRIMIRKGRTMIFSGELSIVEEFPFRGI